MFALSVLALVLSAPPAKTDPKADLAAQIIGEWTIHMATIGGDSGDGPDKSGKNVFIFEPDGKLIVKTDLGKKIRTSKGTYKLNTSKTPAQIDATSEAGGVDADFTGIVKVEGDTLTICMGETRPKAFESKKDTLMILLVLKRVKKEK